MIQTCPPPRATVGLLASMLPDMSHAANVAVPVSDYAGRIVTGILAGLMGCAIRHKGATV